jgi:hypothetical protein
MVHLEKVLFELRKIVLLDIVLKRQVERFMIKELRLILVVEKLHFKRELREF